MKKFYEFNATADVMFILIDTASNYGSMIESSLTINGSSFILTDMRAPNYYSKGNTPITSIFISILFIISSFMISNILSTPSYEDSNK